MPPEYIRPKSLDDVLLVEVNPRWTRQRGTLKSGTNFALGAVLALVSGKFQPVAPASEVPAEKTAVAVLAEAVDATDADKPGVLIRRGAVVAAGQLVWPSGATSQNKTDGATQLEAVGIVVTETL